MLKGILFDLDDTLIDWGKFGSDWSELEQQHLRGVFDYIAAEIHPLNDPAEYYAEFRTRTNDAWVAARTDMRAPHLGNILVESAVACGVPGGTLDARRLLEEYRWRAHEGTVMFPEVPETIELLQRNQIKVGIVTNAYQPMWLRDIEIQEYGLFELFPDCRISAADVGYLKPHPAIFQTALDQLDLKPAETVFIGDSLESDVLGAQRAGMRAVWRKIAHRAHPHADIKPDAEITSLQELPAILDSWYPGWRSGDS